MRPAVVVISLGMVAACGGLAYVHGTGEEPAAAVSTAAKPPSHTGQAPAPVTARAPDAANASVARAAPERPDTVDQWIEDTQDSDPRIRAAAIAKLANAPKAQALTALKDVLESGDPEVDRHIALNSLHTLALRDGDSNGQVRDLMRRAIYHSDNDGVTQTAQSLLDDLEAALAER